MCSGLPPLLVFDYINLKFEIVIRIVVAIVEAMTAIIHITREVIGTVVEITAAITKLPAIRVIMGHFNSPQNYFL